MIEVCKNFPSPEMMERLAKALEKDTVDLFAIASVQKEWKKTVLVDIENLITNRLEELRKTPEQQNC